MISCGRFAGCATELDEQRIVWVNGRHLPQDIELSEKAKGIRLAE